MRTVDRDKRPPPETFRRPQTPARGGEGGSGYKNGGLVGMAVLKKEAKVRGTTDIIGIISLILLVLIFLRVFAII
jgi:hypothetical protein